jgi:hypothetical protein
MNNDFPWRVERVFFLQGTEEERMGDVSEDVEKLMEEGDLLWDVFQDHFLPDFDKDLFLEAIEEEGFEFLVDHILTPAVIVEIAVPIPSIVNDVNNTNYCFSWHKYQTRAYALEGEEISSLKVLSPKAERLWKDVFNKELNKWKSKNP